MKFVLEVHHGEDHVDTHPSLTVDEVILILVQSTKFERIVIYEDPTPVESSAVEITPEDAEFGMETPKLGPYGDWNLTAPD